MGYSIYVSKNNGLTWQATDKTGMSKSEAEDTASQMTTGLYHGRFLYHASDDYLDTDEFKRLQDEAFNNGTFRSM